MDSSAFGPLCAEFLCKSWLVICRRVDGFFFFFFLRFDLRCGFCLFFFYREGGSRLGLEILFVLRRLVSRILNRRGLVKYCWVAGLVAGSGRCTFSLFMNEASTVQLSYIGIDTMVCLGGSIGILPQDYSSQFSIENLFPTTMDRRLASSRLMIGSIIDWWWNN